MTVDLFHTTRVLIVDANLGNARLLRGVLASVGVGSVAIAAHTGRALDLLGGTQFQAIFCDGESGPLDAVGFSIAVRRSAEIRNPRLPIIVVTDRAHRSDVEAARDAGINDFIVRPVSVATVRRKLLAVLAAPKTFIQTEAFSGPDRRRKRERRLGKSVTASAGRDRRKARPARRSTDAKLKPRS